MKLGADAVELVFHVNGRCAREAFPDRLRGWLGTGEHALDRAKQRKFGALQFTFRREHCGRSQIAEEHVGLLHFIKGRGKGRGDRFLDESFAQSDAQIAGQNLHEVLSFARR